MAMDNTVTAPAASAVGARQGVFLQAALAMMLGLFIVGMAGFSHSETIHNAAHDTRHSNAFPCH